MAQIIDGLCDFDNVTADMIARHNMSMYGTSDYVLQIDECLEYDLVSNNEIHVKDGMYIMQGRRGCVKKGTTDICIIENGGQAVNRNDIIVIEYVKDEATRLESHTTKVIKGVPAEVAVDPELVTGDINAGAVLHQMPLYRVKIEGLNVVAVEQMFEIGSVAAETVNPMEATEPGFAADALAVKNQFSEQNKNIADCFQSVSNGKALVASAITGKGVTTASDATFETMANNITSITGLKLGNFKRSGERTAITSVSGLVVGKTYALCVLTTGESSSAMSGAFKSGFTVLKQAFVSWAGGYSTHAFILKATATTATFGWGIYTALIQLD